MVFESLRPRAVGYHAAVDLIMVRLVCNENKATDLHLIGEFRQI